MIPDFQFRPLDFRGVLGNAWLLTRRTAAGTGLVALAVLLPLGLTLDHFAKSFYQTLARLIEEHGIPELGSSSTAMLRAFGPIAGTALLFYTFSLLYALGFVYVQTVATSLSWEAASGGSRRTGQLLRASLGRPFRRNILQSILIAVTLMMGSLAASLLEAFASAIATVLVALVEVGFIMAASYFAVSTIFRVHEIIIDGRGPWRGLIASMVLVRGNWWRVALMTLLVALLFLVFAVVLPGLATPQGAFGLFASEGLAPGNATDPTTVAALMAERARLYTFASSLVQAFGIPLVVLMGTNLLTALYIDLRVRRGDFDEEITGDQASETSSDASDT
jgi:hypothetical protein